MSRSAADGAQKILKVLAAGARPFWGRAKKPEVIITKIPAPAKSKSFRALEVAFEEKRAASDAADKVLLRDQPSEAAKLLRLTEAHAATRLFLRMAMAELLHFKDQHNALGACEEVAALVRPGISVQDAVDEIIRQVPASTALRNISAAMNLPMAELLDCGRSLHPALQASFDTLGSRTVVVEEDGLLLQGEQAVLCAIFEAYSVPYIYINAAGQMIPSPYVKAAATPAAM